MANQLPRLRPAKEFLKFFAQLLRLKEPLDIFIGVIRTQKRVGRFDCVFSYLHAIAMYMYEIHTTLNLGVECGVNNKCFGFTMSLRAM